MGRGSGESLRTFSGHTSSVTSVAFSPDGQYVLTGSADGTARLWDASSGESLRTFTGHTAWVSSVAFSPDGRYVLTGSKDGTARLWDAASGESLRTFSGHTSVGDQRGLQSRRALCADRERRRDGAAVGRGSGRACAASAGTPVGEQRGLQSRRAFCADRERGRDGAAVGRGKRGESADVHRAHQLR